MKTKSLLFATLLVALSSAPPVLRAANPLAALDDNAAARSKEDALYSEGTRAINDARWAQAETIFTNIAQQHGARAEAALYWKAYAENKQGNATRALQTCSELRQAYPHGNWINECGALEIEIRGKSDDPLPPQAEQDEDLKLLALNSLMQQDESRALPIIQQILNGDKSEKLKLRALFVLAQDQSPQAQALLGQVASGERNPALQRKAIEMLAVGRGKRSAETLAGIYRQSTNDDIKNAILHAYLVIGTPDPLVEAASQNRTPGTYPHGGAYPGSDGRNCAVAHSLSQHQQLRDQGGHHQRVDPGGAEGRRCTGHHCRLGTGSPTAAQSHSQSRRCRRHVGGAIAGGDLQEKFRSGDQKSRCSGAVCGGR